MKTNKYLFSKLISWVFIIISILILVYTYYRSGIVHQGTQNAIYFKYYIFSLIAIMFWGVTLVLKDSVRVNIIMVTIALIISLYLVEGALNVYDFSQKKSKWGIMQSKLDADFDERTKLVVIDNLIDEGFDAVPMVHSGSLLENIKEQFIDQTLFNSFLPLGGMSNKTCVESNESGKYMIFLCDRHGFNNPDSDWDSSTIDWLLIGDSFALGQGAMSGQNISSQIRTLTNQSVINLGVGDSGPLLELARLKEYAEKIEPKRVIWHYFEGNDLRGDLDNEKSSQLLMNYLQDDFSQNLSYRQEEIDKILKEYIIQEYKKTTNQLNDLMEAFEWLRLYEIRNFINFDIEAVDSVPVNIDPLFSKILVKAKTRIEAWGGKLYFVYLPEYSRYKNKITSHNQYRKKSEVIDLVNRLDIPVIDIHQEVFSNNPDPLSLFPFRLSGHYNAEGYSDVAKAIVKGVNKYEQSNK